MADIQAESARKELHSLVDQIADSEVGRARKLLRSLLDPVALSILMAPLDDEPETEDEVADVEAARRETGPGTPHDEVLHEFGL